MDSVSDRRARKTRTALIEALGRLVAVVDLDAINVQRICDEADVARSSFYAHFDNKRELLQAMLVALGQELHSGKSADHAGPLPFLPGLLEHIEARRGKGRSRLLLGPAMFAEFLTFVGGLIEDELRRRRPRPDVMLVSFVRGGVIAAIETWLKRGCRESRSLVASRIERAAEVALRIASE